MQQLLGELQRAAGAERARLLDEPQLDPEPAAVTEDRAHAVGHVAARHHDLVDAVAAQPVEHEADEGPVHERDDRLRMGGGERAQARALAPREDQGLHYAETAGSRGWVGLIPGRPTPSYVRPASRTASASRKLRPSMTTSPRIAAATSRR